MSKENPHIVYRYLQLADDLEQLGFKVAVTHDWFSVAKGDFFKCCKTIDELQGFLDGYCASVRADRNEDSGG